jgi:hypothetical protein
MTLRNIAMDVQQDGIAVAVLSPGVVNSCVAGMMKVMDRLTVEGSGRWSRFPGEVLKW